MISANNYYKLPSGYLWYFFYKKCLIIFFYSFLYYLFFFAFIEASFLDVLFGFFILFALPGIIWLNLYNKSFSFIVKNNEITINSGIIHKKSKTLLFQSVQTVNIETSLSKKLFGLSELEIWTASPAQSRGEADVTLILETKDAEQLKDIIHL